MKKIAMIPVANINGKVERIATAMLVNCNDEVPSASRIVMKLSVADGLPKEYVSNKGAVCHLVSNNELNVYSYISQDFYKANIAQCVDPVTSCMVLDIDRVPSANDVLKNLGGAK